MIKKMFIDSETIICGKASLTDCKHRIY